MPTVIFFSKITIILTFISLSLSAQTPAYSWEEDSVGQPSSIRHRTIVPKDYKVFHLTNKEAFQAALWDMPPEHRVRPENSPLEVILPSPSGRQMVFKLVQYEMMESRLAQEYPGIRTFYGVSADGKGGSVRLGWTYRGLYATVYTAEKTYYIDPLHRDNLTEYQVYVRGSLAPHTDWTCHNLEEKNEWTTDRNVQYRAGDCALRTYRLALAVTGEYANFHGAYSSAEQNLVMSEIVTAIGRVNGIFERDLTLRLVLINDTDDLFNYDPDDDVYTNDDGFEMLGENQQQIDLIIGVSGYDIGHVFSTAGGGVASLRSPCTGRKARGVTGLANPTGDYFYVDYVAHEMGHQFGANHVQNNDCNYAGHAGVEPGSGSTIMSYAGICSPNVQSNVDDYYNGYSIREMEAFMDFGQGGECGRPVNSHNNIQPEVILLRNREFIPKSTPFFLEALANDPSGDNADITYCWEQTDSRQDSMPPNSENLVGPMFRSIAPVSEGRRYFPSFPDVLANNDPEWEVLPSVGRSLNFQVTVRDNHPGGGCTGELSDEVHLQVVGDAGPFLITSPNTNLNWPARSTQIATWSVANTRYSAVQAETVDILLSVDGGSTFDTLIKNTLNTGSAQIIVPDLVTQNARLLIGGHHHIFYDVSDENFNITMGSADYAMRADPMEQYACAIQPSITYKIISQAFGNFSGDLELNVSGLPDDISVNISPMTITAGDTASVTLSAASLNVGDYTFQLNAHTPGRSNRTIDLTFKVEDSSSKVYLSAPMDNSTGENLFPEFIWQDVEGAVNYVLQVANDADFNQIIQTETTTQTTLSTSSGLEADQSYFWRVRPIFKCTEGDWSDTYRFTTLGCVTRPATDLPIFILSSGPNVVESELQIFDQGDIDFIGVENLKINHTWISDLTVKLKSPAGTLVTLFDQICYDEDSLHINISDNGNTLYPCPPVNNIEIQSEQALDAFSGEEAEGMWTLIVEDNANGDGGELVSWDLKVCAGDLRPLPITLTDFYLTEEKGNIKLDWQTSTEIDNSGFEIQRRVGGGAFEKLGWVDGAGNSHQPRSYYFLDEDAPHFQKLYYRLKQIDYNGQYSYSPIRSIQLDKRTEELLLFPQPSDRQITLQWAGYKNISAILYSSEGKRQAKWLLQPGENTRDVSHLPAGIYWLRFVTSSGQMHKKVVIF